MQKKIGILFLTVLFTIAPQLKADEVQSFEPFTASVIGSKVRLRTSPTLEAHVIRETTCGEMFAVVGEDNDYYVVIPPRGTKGYVFRTFILDGVVEGDRVNVRLYPDIDAPVVGRLNAGDRVASTVSDINNKWLEIDLPENSHFYLSKEYVEKKGDINLITTVEKRHIQATHLLSSAFLFAQAEIQKPFEQIDLDAVNEKFETLVNEYQDLPDIANRAHEACSIIQDIYVQKKIAFLESKADHKSVALEIDADHIGRLAKLGIEIPALCEQKNASEVAEVVAETVMLPVTVEDDEITDKMLVWKPLEESLYHLWAMANSERPMDEYYEEEELSASVLTGIVEPYSRPVKNRPGDFILRNDNLPVAFLYSTRVNLQKLIGKKVTLIASPRPNHNFAFPAYFVLSID